MADGKDYVGRVAISRAEFIDECIRRDYWVRLLKDGLCAFRVGPGPEEGVLELTMAATFEPAKSPPATFSVLDPATPVAAGHA